MNERVKWIDIAKFFGIFAIYLGHFGEQAGNAYNFVFTHHVALFFFISGCVENYNQEENILKYAWKKVKTIMVPFWVFAVLSAIVAVIYKNYQWLYAKPLIVEVLRGVVRNTYVAASLWFLTCLFVMQIMFALIKKLKYKWLIFVACIGIYFIAIRGLDHSPLYQPSWYYNVDSALYYIVYYAIGYLIYPYVVELFKLDTWKKKILFAITGVLSVAYSTGMFFGVDMLSYLHFPEWLQLFTPILVTCVLIWTYFVIARLIQDVSILAEIGQNTLYLCGSEYMIKIIVPNLLSAFGLATYLVSPMGTYLYVGALLLLANKFLVPIEKYIINKIVR